MKHLELLAGAVTNSGLFGYNRDFANLYAGGFLDHGFTTSSLRGCIGTTPTVIIAAAGPSLRKRVAATGASVLGFILCLILLGLTAMIEYFQALHTLSPE